ncbi:MAG: lipase family protein [Burkholderiaceae bacterium]
MTDLIRPGAGLRAVAGGAPGEHRGLRPTGVLRAAALVALAAVLTACGGDSRERGEVASVTPTAAFSVAEVDASVAQQPGLGQLIGAPSQCGVAQHQLVYESVDPRGRGARASAGLLIPTGCQGPFPVLVYHHGTTVFRAFTMSDPANTEAGLQRAMFAAQGYVVVMPDYLGYGESDLGYHPYLQAENTAAVSIDALRAARTALAERGVPLSDKLFLSGYSQGGHAAMATHRAIERDHADEFPITASAPMAGPYALEETFVSGMANPGQGASLFAALTYTSYQKSWGDIYASAQDAFQAPWADTIEDLLPGTSSTTELITSGKLPLAIGGPGGLLTDSFLALFADPDSSVRRRLADNSLLDWAPKGPMMLCSGARDPVVTFANTITATGYFASRGVTVTPVDVEQVPAFQPTIAAMVAAAPDLSTYHGTIVPPLCLSVVKNQFFDPRN